MDLCGTARAVEMGWRLDRGDGLGEESVGWEWRCWDWIVGGLNLDG